MKEQEPKNSGHTREVSVQRMQRTAMGPMLVDQTLRQAITHCWMMLPDDQKTPKNVEKEMTRLLTRALENLHEDAASFGFSDESA